MKIIYNVAINLLSAIISLLSLFNRKAKLRTIGTKKAIEFIKLNAENFKNPIWFHASSVGEFEQAKPLIIKIRELQPNQQILVTFFSSSGFEANKNYKLADYILYLPDDTKANANLFIKTVKPKTAIFIKYEFWFNYLNVLRTNQIPTFSVSAIFRENHFVFKPYASFIRNELTKLEAIFVQNTESLELLKQHNFTNAILSGDTRFDRVAEIANSNPGIIEIADFCDNKEVVVFGSVWAKDMELIIPFINNYASEKVKYIIVPHEIHSAEISEYITKLQAKTIRYSNITEYSNEKILIIDTIGLLSKVYKYAKLAYIGGGFGTGIHNILEAAVYGVPILFGPKYKKFKEATDLTALQGAIAISDYTMLEKTAKAFLENETFHHKTKTICANYVTENLGAGAIIMGNSKFSAAIR